MANLSHNRSKAQLIGTLNPKAWDALKPHTPFVFSNAHVELMVADAVKLVAGAITDKGLAREVMELSRTMAKQAGGALIASWEPGDELCPPWPWPWPGPRPWWLDVFGPQPEPWKAVLAPLHKFTPYATTYRYATPGGRVPAAPDPARTGVEADQLAALVARARKEIAGVGS